MIFSVGVQEHASVGSSYAMDEVTALMEATKIAWARCVRLCPTSAETTESASHALLFVMVSKTDILDTKNGQGLQQAPKPAKPTSV